MQHFLNHVSKNESRMGKAWNNNKHSTTVGTIQVLMLLPQNAFTVYLLSVNTLEKANKESRYPFELGSNHILPKFLFYLQTIFDSTRGVASFQAGGEGRQLQILQSLEGKKQT